MKRGQPQTPKVIEALSLWLSYAREIEHDLEVYRQVDIQDWFSGEMSSRKLMLYLDGLLITTDGWYAKVIRRDYAEIEAERIAAEERLHRAETKAQVTGTPLEMSEL